MAAQKKVTESALLKAAGKTGRTKVELAEKLGFSYGTISAAVNACVASGRLVVLDLVKTGKRGRPAPKFGVPSES